MVFPTVSLVSLAAISLAGIVACQSEDFDCCFTLEVSGDLGGKLKHGTTGDLRVNSNFQEAFICADESADRLQDSIGNGCRFSPPSMKFECLSGVPGDGDFFFDFGEATDGGEKPILLTYDGHDKFLACPSEGPSSDAGSFVLYSRAKEDQEGCVDVSLQQVGPSSGCYDRGLLEKFSLVVNPDGWASINDENSTFGSEDAITVGTFECGVDRSPGIVRTISFLAESVNGWSLSFAQAGMGTQSQWPLGVGAYVTACDDTTPWP
ncbi:Choline dehydrogenase [Verticillium dahliae VDG1]|nr:Choline dehydrogenase [Verticillium dahliae VDG1]